MKKLLYLSAILIAIIAFQYFHITPLAYDAAYKQGAIDQRNANIFVWNNEIYPKDSLFLMCKYRPGDTLVFRIDRCNSCRTDTIVVDSVRLGKVYQECRYMSEYRSISEDALHPL